MAKNRLFGWMFVEDSNKESETVKPRTSQEASAPATVAVPSPVVTSVPAPTIMASGDVDTKLVELLERKINEANLPGPDYLELLQSAEQMKQYIPDETTRLKAAFGSIQGMDPRMTKVSSAGSGENGAGASPGTTLRFDLHGLINAADNQYVKDYTSQIITTYMNTGYATILQIDNGSKIKELLYKNERYGLNDENEKVFWQNNTEFE